MVCALSVACCRLHRWELPPCTPPRGSKRRADPVSCTACEAQVPAVTVITQDGDWFLLRTGALARWVLFRCGRPTAVVDGRYEASEDSSETGRPSSALENTVLHYDWQATVDGVTVEGTCLSCSEARAACDQVLADEGLTGTAS